MHQRRWVRFRSPELRHHSYRERVDAMLFHRFTGIAEHHLNVFGHKLRIIRVLLRSPSLSQKVENKLHGNTRALHHWFPHQTAGSIRIRSCHCMYRSPIKASILQVSQRGALCRCAVPPRHHLLDYNAAERREEPPHQHGRGRWKGPEGWYTEIVLRFIPSIRTSSGECLAEFRDPFRVFVAASIAASRR